MCQSSLDRTYAELSLANINSPLQKSPKSVVDAALQHYLFSLLALLLSLEKYFHPQGVFFPSCFLCLIFATC